MTLVVAIIQTTSSTLVILSRTWSYIYDNFSYCHIHERSEHFKKLNHQILSLSSGKCTRLVGAAPDVVPSFLKISSSASFGCFFCHCYKVFHIIAGAYNSESQHHQFFKQFKVSVLR